MPEAGDRRDEARGRDVAGLRYRSGAVQDAPGQFPWPLTEPAVPVSSFDLRFRLLGTEVIVLEPDPLRRKALTAAQAFIVENSQPSGLPGGAQNNPDLRAVIRYSRAAKPGPDRRLRACLTMDSGHAK